MIDTLSEAEELCVDQILGILYSADGDRDVYTEVLEAIAQLPEDRRSNVRSSAIEAFLNQLQRRLEYISAYYKQEVARTQQLIQTNQLPAPADATVAQEIAIYSVGKANYELYRYYRWRKVVEPILRAILASPKSELNALVNEISSFRLKVSSMVDNTELIELPTSLNQQLEKYKLLRQINSYELISEKTLFLSACEQIARLAIDNPEPSYEQLLDESTLLTLNFDRIALD